MPRIPLHFSRISGVHAVSEKVAEAVVYRHVRASVQARISTDSRARVTLLLLTVLKIKMIVAEI